MARALTAHALLGIAGLLLSDCSSPCVLQGGSCLDLRVEGTGSYADLAVELVYGTPSTTRTGLPTDPVTLPTELRVVPPDNVTPSMVHCLNLTAGNDGAAPLTRGALQIGGPAEVGGLGRVDWEDGQHTQATVRPFVLLRKDVVSGGSTGLPYLDFALGDFDGNGHPDIVNILLSGTNITNNMGLYPNDGTPDGVAYSTRAYFGLNGIAVATGDINGDGHTDVIVSSPYSGYRELQLGLGNGKFTTAPTALGAGLSAIIAVGDFDHDGIADTASANGTTLGFNFGHANSGTTSPLGAYIKMTLPAVARSMLMVDLDHDQKDDLLISSDTGNSLIVLYGNDQTGFTLPKTFSINPGPADSAVGDMNGDGIPDIVVADVNSGIDLLVGTGGRTLAPVAPGGRTYPCNSGPQQTSALADA